MTYKEFVKSTRICKYCGKEFVPFHPSNQFTCGSAECQYLAHKESNNAWYAGKTLANPKVRLRKSGKTLCRICGRPIVRYQAVHTHADCNVKHEGCMILELVNTLLIGDAVTRQQRWWLHNHGYSLEELRHDIVDDTYRSLIVR